MKSFTLIETLIAIFVFTLAMGAVSGLILMAYRTQSYTWQQSIAIDEARKGIETMVKEIRMAGEGEDGSYPIEIAEDKEFMFYSDIDKDGKTEKVRYFLGTVNSGNQTQECQTSTQGSSCSVSFSNFLKGNLISAQVKISVDGDLGQNNKEYVDIYADGQKLATLCLTGCSDCTGTWQGSQTFDVTNFASDNLISFLAQGSSYVGPACPSPLNYTMKAKFEFSFTEDISALSHEFKKGVIDPVIDAGGKISYPSDQEKVSLLTSYIRNVPPIFEYYDQNGNKITDYPARLKDTKMMKVYLVVNIDPNRPPNEFELESSVQLRNLKNE